MNHNPAEPRFAFFGTPYVARDTLERLVAGGFVPAVVITNPDRPRDRSQELTPSETNVWAKEHGIPVLTPEKLDTSFLKTLKTYNCEYAVVTAYGRILPESLIAFFPKGVFNIHYSLLPAYRGASPVETAILRNEKVTGVTVQKMVYELDAGAILGAIEEEITLDDTTTTLRTRLIEKGADLLMEVLPPFFAGALTPTEQDHTQASYAKKIRKEDGELSLDGDPLTNWNTYRAYNEWPGTYFFIERGGRKIRVKITKAERATDGTFRVLRVIPEGKKEMDFSSFVAQSA